MSDFTHIAWTDLETTGLDPDRHEVLEVGIVLTDCSLNEIAESSWLVRPKALDMLSLDPVVMNMHGSNGLFAEIIDEKPYTVDSIDWRIVDWLNDQGAGQVALGGSGVSHFDVRWIRRHLPCFGRRLYRSTVDVGVIRRFVQHVVQRPELLLPQPTLNHRALDDAMAHLEEARHYQRLMEQF